MPVRSSASSVLKWPNNQAVDRAVRAWAKLVADSHPEVVRIGYFGSYARGDWGVGSDLDLVVIVGEAAEPFSRRPLALNTLELPVPTDLLVYTTAEWRRLLEEPRPFAQRMDREAVWVVREPSG
ncbi:MAG: nucleotidyltransferase domain-containing protein [Thermoleophilia bacterium]